MKSYEIYLAAPWVMGKDARVARKYLQKKIPGLKVISRWIARSPKKIKPTYDYTKDKSFSLKAGREQARIDLEDIRRARCLVVLNHVKSEGKVVEQGIALALGKPVIVVGGKTNIFHYLKEVKLCKNLSKAVKELRRLKYGMS